MESRDVKSGAASKLQRQLMYTKLHNASTAATHDASMTDNDRLPPGGSGATDGKTGDPQPPSRVLVPRSQPVTILATDAARLYRHLHPALVLSLLYFGFGQLIADPVTALSQGLVPVAALQLVYCVVCLPASSGVSIAATGGGGGSSTTNGSASGTGSSLVGGTGGAAAGTPKTPKRKRVQFAKPPPTVWSKTIPAIYSLLLALVLALPLTTVLLICHGAPLTTHLTHTILCAAHLAVLGALPLFYVHGVDTRAWREIAAAALPFDEMWGGTVGALVGAWIGAVPIPLDWDREWQKWPVTIVTGAYLGWELGRLGGEWGIRGKRIDFVEKDADDA